VVETLGNRTNEREYCNTWCSDREQMQVTKLPGREQIMQVKIHICQLKALLHISKAESHSSSGTAASKTLRASFAVTWFSTLDSPDVGACKSSLKRGNKTYKPYLIQEHCLML
jgi:hypothetical protein